MVPYFNVTVSHHWLQVAFISDMFHGMGVGRSQSPDKVAPRGASRRDCRGHQNCRSKGPCLIYTRTEEWILGYLQIQLCPISVWDKVTLHKGNAVCLIQAYLTVSTSLFSACFCVKQMFYRGLGCVLCQDTAWPSTAKLVIPLQWGHILFLYGEQGGSFLVFKALQEQLAKAVKWQRCWESAVVYSQLADWAGCLPGRVRGLWTESFCRREGRGRLYRQGFLGCWKELWISA